MPMLEALDRIVSHGIGLRAGIVVGFDHDDAGIFSTLLEFFDAAPLPTLSISVLNAPAQTDLYHRLEAEGRLRGSSVGTGAGKLFDTNIVPAGMSRAELLEGALWLSQQAFSPARFKERMLRFIDRFPADLPAARRGAAEPGRYGYRLFSVLKRELRGDPEVSAMTQDILRAGMAKPAVLPAIMDALALYAQTLHVMNRETEGATEVTEAAA